MADVDNRNRNRRSNRAGQPNPKREARAKAAERHVATVSEACAKDIERSLAGVREFDGMPAGFVAAMKAKAQKAALFVGSCFADNLGRRFVENRFRATVNPFGVMYNPASILHTVEKSLEVQPRVAVFTLGTNHVYILKETGEIVDNCQKRPQRLLRKGN